MGLRLPFSDIEVAVFRHLRVAPSQLHPNDIAFMREFKIVFHHLRIGSIIPLFLYCFHLQRSKVDEKWGCVSLKQGNGKIFKAYMESVRHFKDKYILVQPYLTKVMLNVFRTVPSLNEDGTPRLNDLAEPVAKLVYKFPFQWTRKHFDSELGSYVWREGELGDEDMEIFVVLTAFVARIPRVQEHESCPGVLY
ncbi:hypothetical protein RYX36_008370 [Vicia faba]